MFTPSFQKNMATLVSRQRQKKSMTVSDLPATRAPPTLMNIVSTGNQEAERRELSRDARDPQNAEALGYVIGKHR